MTKKIDNPFSPGIVNEFDSGQFQEGVHRGSILPVAMILLGIATGTVGLALVSNKYGNTDIYGLLVVPVGSYLLAAGICSLFMRLRYALAIAIIAAPVSLILLFVLYWVLIFAAAAVS